VRARAGARGRARRRRDGRTDTMQSTLDTAF